ncbi:ATP-binding cassette domain-containing protein [Variovorax guangxiensis]|uniref:ATP-binding cassette domain-containing protein n=1 Tax=Variovorax guangxiensis TaxID=1775474 RepID=A0A3S1F5U1_9BURK|nr:ABC transporter ATP-binding protein [Variovorax guangxiensis]RUR71265.1 ATP-binding cassette domain-containing protein [Variovorax guangxiensis]
MRKDTDAACEPTARDGRGVGAKVSVRGVSKRFGATLAADRIDLDIRDGEFLTLLGASGCGKTTLMRMIAGFERPAEGSIFIDGRDVTNLPPRERRLGMVFQQYSLFPHMTVAENIAYGLQAQRLQARQITERVDEMLELIQLPHLRERRPGQLSGGQQQRVALARALATRPSVLMLDEPLGALDLKLRQQLQTELKRIHRETRTTFLFVTHDQEEALHLSDRIAVMRGGRIEQLDNPTSIYMRPVNDFVADFIGDISFLTGDYDPLAGVFELGGTVRIPVRLDRPAGPARLAVRPEQVKLGAGPGALAARIREVVPETGSTLLHLELDDRRPLLSRVLGLPEGQLYRDQAVHVMLADCCVAFDPS